MTIRFDAKKEFARIPPLTSLEQTDPGITPAKQQPLDEFISEKKESPVTWVQKKLSKRKEMAEAREIIAKIDRLPTAPNEVIARYYDTDVTRLMAIARNHPKETHQLLRRALEQSPIPESTEVWYQQIRVACGDATALIPALESLERT